MKVEGMPYPDGRLHTAWQWLALERRVVRPCAPSVIRQPFDHPWHYYRGYDTYIATDEEYARLRAMYTVLYGGWWRIDLDHTRYDGRKWY